MKSTLNQSSLFLNVARTVHTAAKPLTYTKETLDRNTLSELLRVTPKEIVERAMDVRLTFKIYEVGSKEGFRRTYYKYPSYYNQIRVQSASSKRSGSGRKHQSMIRFYGPPDLTTPCWVWCDCDFFKFTLEVALTSKNTSSIKNSNGEPPTIRNPHNLPYLCKHLVRAAKWALTLTEDKAAQKFEEEGQSEA